MNDICENIDHISKIFDIPGPFGDAIRASRKRKADFIARYGEDAWMRRNKELAERDMKKADMENEKERSLLRLENSGFGKNADEVKEFLRRNSFENFNAAEPWQKSMLEMCQKFISQNEARFMYLSGAPGGGKTHLGTATSAHYLNAGDSTRYTIHGLLMTELKGNVNDDEGYAELLEKYGCCDVLYIDDFMKPVEDPATGRIKPPTAADIDHSFKLINLRYVRNVITIITSERTLEDILAIDEALGSRIKQRCGEFVMDVSRGKGRNYRMNSKKQ